MEEDNCKYIGSMGIRKSCKHTSLINGWYGNTIQDWESKGYNFNNVKDGDTFYIKLDYIPNFRYVIDKLPAKIILVSGCSDYTTPNDLFNNEHDFLTFVNNDKIIHWFVQNCVYKHPKITLLPIGLDYHTLNNTDNHPWGDRLKPIEQEQILTNIKNNSKPFWERQLKAYGNFHFSLNAKYGYDRVDALNQLDSTLIHYENRQIKRDETWSTQSNFAFVISPHGNGLDCHRTWEALVLGCIPIVRTSVLDELYTDLPVLIVNSWSDVNLNLLLTTINKFKNTQFNYDKLTLKWLMNFIESKV